MLLSRSKLLLAFCVALTALFYSVSPEVFAKQSEQPSTQGQSNASQIILLEGFPPETKIYYTILSGQDVLAEGMQETSLNGDLTVKSRNADNNKNQNRIYDLQIEKDGEYLDILIRHDLKTGKVSASGKGLNQFANIGIAMSGKTMQTKADWSGAFEENSIFSKRDKSSQNFEIALHNFGNLRAPGLKPNPAIIKILQAPGGGLLSQTPNLPPSLSPPSSGKYPLSTSNGGALASQSQAIVRNYVTAMMLITEQLSAVMMQQMLSIGQFFDAKIQMEVQRTHQELKAEAVKDYHPSMQMCQVGSYIRSLANTEFKANADKLALNDVMMERFRAQQNASNSIDPSNDVEARLKQIREVYCNPKDNNNGMLYLCQHDRSGAAPDPADMGKPAPNGIGGDIQERINKDINFTRTLDYPLTVDMDMNDGVESADEQDVMALAKHLYWPNSLNYGDKTTMPKRQAGLLDAQRVIALKNVAHNSYVNVASLKARAPKPPAGIEPGWTFMKTMMRDFGMTDPEIEKAIGVEPSYWAQMDIMTKKLYQTPNFFTNLYDKPANVDRISVTLDAIKLMQMRDHYNSQLRREMLSSGMLETELGRGGHYNRISTDLRFNNR